MSAAPPRARTRRFRGARFRARSLRENDAATSSAATEAAIITANLRARLTILYGPSGVGKSSLVLAGVVPAFARERARGGATDAAPVRRLRVPVLARRAAAGARGGDARAASRRSAARSSRPVASRRSLVDELRALDATGRRCSSSSTSSRSTSSTTRRGRRGTVRRQLRAIVNDPTCGCTSSLAARGRPGQARPLQGPHPAPVRQLPARRPPRPRAARRRSTGPIDK